jgi:PAS domain S-box-containing protein
MTEAPRPDDRLNNDLQALQARIASMGTPGVPAGSREALLLSAIIQNFPHNMYIKDSQSRFVIGNQAVARIMGAGTPANLVGKTDADFFPPGRITDKYMADEREIVRTGRPKISYEEELVEPATRERRWILSTKVPLKDPAGTVIGILGIGLDITALRRAEDARRETENRLAGVLSSITDMVFVFDANGVFLSCHVPDEEQLLVDPVQFIGRRHHEVMPPDVNEQFVQALQKNRAGQPAEYEYHLSMHGRARWFSTKLSPILRDSAYVGSVAVVRDISQRKQMEEELRAANLRLTEALNELRRTQQQIIQHERLNALGQMAAGIAHDFNNALMPIMGFSEIFLSSPDILANREESLDMLRGINSSAQKAAETVRCLHEFYLHADISRPRAIDVNRLVRMTVSMTRPKWKEEMGARGIFITAETDLQDVPPLNGNETLLRDALVNVIFNAAEAMPEGGTITIRTRHDAGWVIIEVSDTGTGMTEDVRLRCFEPFFTTRGERRSGLGLATTYGMIRRWNGTIDIETGSGAGTTVIMRLPYEETAVVAARTEDGPIPIPPPLNILVIDDEVSSQHLIERYLRIDHHSTMLSSSGPDGLDKFKQASFDLVITDRAMPQMNGDQVAAAIKEAKPGVPVILLTGFGDIMIEQDEHPRNVDLILSKPINQYRLRQAIARVTGGPR